MSTLKKVAQNSFFYTISSLLLRASSIIFFPIFSLYLTKSDYGILSISQSIVSFVTLFAGLELGKALTRFIFNQNNDEGTDHNSLIYTVLCTSFVFGCVLILFLTFTGPFLFKPILNDIPFFPYVFVFLLSIPFNSFVNTCRVYLKATHKGVKAFVLDTSFFTSNILFNLLFVVVFKMDALGIILSTTINTLIFTLALYIAFYRKRSFSFNRIILNEMLKYGMPLIPFSLLNILFESVDKFFLNADSGSQASGIYYIALTFAAIFSSAKEAIINAFTPWLFANIDKKDEKEISKIINLIFSGAGVLAIGVAWFSKEVLIVLSSNPDFIEAYRYIPFAVMGLFIIFLGQLYNIKTFYYGKYNRYLFIATLIGIIAEVFACYLLIKPYGVYGAVFSRVIAFTVHVAIIAYLSNLEKEKKNIYNAKILVFNLLLACSFMIAPLLFEYSLNFTVLKIFLYLLIVLGFYFAFLKKYKLSKILK